MRVGPVSPGPPSAGTQSYVDRTLILRTLLPGAESLIEVLDVMPPDGSGRIVRRLKVLRGPADVAVEVVPGPGAERVDVWSEGVRVDGLQVWCGVAMTLSNAPPPAPARPLRRLVATGIVRLDTDEELVVTLDPGRRPALSLAEALELEDRAARHWRRVADRVAVPGRYGADAARSALVVAALCGTAGAPVDSPATSLPRVIGGERNRDGRVVHPVDAAAWAEIATSIGLIEESEAALRWLVGALDHEPPLAADLAADGDVAPGEHPLAGLTGWRRSQPVITGSDAADRRSTEPSAAAVAAASSLAAGASGAAALSGWPRVVAHADWLADHWADPDASVWDVRGPDRAWHSPRLATRRALSLAATEARRRHPLDLDAPGWQASRRDIEAWFRERGLGPTGVLTSGVPGSADAALARVARWGPWPADDPVTAGTLARIAERLGHGPWIHPYPPDVDDGLPGTEPARLTATLWVAGALAARGRWDEAHERMEAAIALAGPLHLLPEAVDATTGAPLGNRPAAAAHISFIDTAVALAAAPS